MFAHVGSFMGSQFRYGRSRHSGSHSGSLFFREIIRTVSSFRPFGASSSSMSETKPCLYSWGAAYCCSSSALETMDRTPGGRPVVGHPRVARPGSFHITALYIGCVTASAAGPRRSEERRVGEEGR